MYCLDINGCDKTKNSKGKSIIFTEFIRVVTPVDRETGRLVRQEHVVTVKFLVMLVHEIFLILLNKSK